MSISIAQLCKENMLEVMHVQGEMMFDSKAMPFAWHVLSIDMGM